jgi:hypothetical protein
VSWYANDIPLTAMFRILLCGARLAVSKSIAAVANAEWKLFTILTLAGLTHATTSMPSPLSAFIGHLRGLNDGSDTLLLWHRRVKGVALEMESKNACLNLSFNLS